MDLTQRNSDIIAFFQAHMTIIDIAHAFELPVTRVFSILINYGDLTLADIKEDRRRADGSKQAQDI